MKYLNEISHLNEKHQIYLFYLIPLFFLIGRAPTDIILTYLGINFFISKILISKDFSIFKNKIFQIGLLFCIIQIFVSFFSTNLGVSIIKSFSYLRFILFFAATVYLLKSNYFKLKNFYYVIGICLIFINVDILVQYLIGYDLFGYEPVKNSANSFRYSGSFGDEFVAGNYIQKFLLIFALIIILRSKGFYKKYIFELVVLFSIIIVLITGDRMAFISVIYSLFFIFIFIRKIRFYLIIMGIIITSCIGGMVYFDKGIADRVVSIPKQLLFKKNNEFYNPHLNLIKQSIEIFKNHKFFGTGIKTFRVVCSLKENSILMNSEKEIIKVNFCSNHPHNYYFELLSETGLTGFLAFIIFVFILFYFTGFNKEYASNYKLSFLCLLVFLFPIATTGSFFTNVNSCYFWYFISLVNINLINNKGYY